MPPRTLRTWSLAGRWGVPGLGLLLLVGLVTFVGPFAILSLVRAVGANFVVLVAIFGCHEGVRALALGRCIASSERPRWMQLVRIRFLGEAVRILTSTGPLLSEPARGWLLTGLGVRTDIAFGAAASELIANSTVSALFSVVVLTFLLREPGLGAQLAKVSWVFLFASLAYSAVVVVALWRRAYLIGGVALRLSSLRIGRLRIEVNAVRIRETEDAIFHVLRDRRSLCLQVVALELAAQAILIFEALWTLTSMGIPVGAGTAIAVEALSKLPNSVPLVGAMEGSYALLFRWLGLAAAVGLALSLVKRARSLAIAAIGLVMQAACPQPRQQAPIDRASLPV